MYFLSPNLAEPQHFALWERLLFAALAATSGVLFWRRFGPIIKKILHSRKDPGFRLFPIARRVWDFVWEVLCQAKVIRERPLPGLAHALIFWGFCAFALVTLNHAAVAFGLATDYGVFLLSRIKEARDNGASDSESVAIGLERTGRIVTAAALLFAVAMLAFATSEIIFIKENGVGTALAVLIDATIIRALLVPALMELLGKWNWWAPAPLRRLHERWGISESGTAPAPGQAA